MKRYEATVRIRVVIDENDKPTTENVEREIERLLADA